jgi:dienelactone hydrolase
MRTFIKNLLLLTLLTACAAPLSPATPTPDFVPPTLLTGQWITGITGEDGSPQSILLNFDLLTLNIEPRTQTWPLTVTQSEKGITASAIGSSSDPFKQIKFTGSFFDQALSGELIWDDQLTSVTLTPLMEVDDLILENYVGVYQFESGRALSILHNPSFQSAGLEFFHKGLSITDLENGDSRGLYSIDEFTFGIGALRVMGAPLSGRVQFIANDQGEAMGLMWWDAFDGITPSADSGQYATRVNYLTEEVTFTSADGAVMAGLLTSPETSEPHAAFMMLHGSEPGVKDGFGQQILAHYMISRGVALLTYDKRGVGDSEGVYRESPDQANIDLIASDAVAGTDYLATRSEIDPTKIGLIGGSQAGWVIPVAVAESENVDFFVIQSGPVLSFAQEDRYSSVTNDGDSAATYDPEQLDQTIREMTPSGVDSIPVLTEITKPGLWLWGSVDKSVPITVSAENLQALIDSGRDNFSYVILANGDHNLNESEHGYFAEIPYSPRVLYFATLAEWLEKNVLK